MSPLPRFGATATATLLAVGAVGAWPTWKAAGEPGLVALGLAGAAALVGALVGFLPLAAATDVPLERKAQAALLGVVFRLAATGAAVAAVLLLGAAEATTAFLLWTALDYVALLAVETRIALSLARTGGAVSA
jgi:hypothetical protein